MLESWVGESHVVLVRLGRGRFFFFFHKFNARVAFVNLARRRFVISLSTGEHAGLRKAVLRVAAWMSTYHLFVSICNPLLRSCVLFLSLLWFEKIKRTYLAILKSGHTLNFLRMGIMTSC